ncbi:hypothetical protein V6N12_029144 [Hibiscus sabdariffa]|uniref:RNase H type-1 domain-containing protein n=1 Tax=Hibiscus sabdariffa TaxID=183260 RepID=A0ABR2A6X9_9ROSI
MRLSRGWFKTNVDGACKKNEVVAWGVLRDDQGAWLWGFTRNLDTLAAMSRRCQIGEVLFNFPPLNVVTQLALEQQEVA